MLSDFHMHTKYCDGANTPEEMVLSAIEKGLSSVGISGHGYTDFDTTYCIKDPNGYINEINRLKEKYKNEIEIYLGVEEDMHNPLSREDYDYIIGSCHYVCKAGKYYPIDSDVNTFKHCIEKWNGDFLAFAEDYYKSFTDYILDRKPNIVGHYDLITKFDENEYSVFLNNPEYKKIAEKYMLKALESNCIFEVNVGAIHRGYRKNPYPSEHLLNVICKGNGKIILSSDSHSKETICFNFDETKKYLKELGFKVAYTLYKKKFVKYEF